MSRRIKIIKINEVKIFLFALFLNLKVNLVGQLALSEILAVLDSFSLKKWVFIFKKVPDVKKINIAYLVFLFSQIVSDIFNNSAVNDLIRGWANILMAMVLITFVSRYLYKSINLIVLILISEIFSILLFKSYDIDNLESSGSFKFIVAPILNNIVLIISWYYLKFFKNRVHIIVLLLISYGLFSVFFDFRSNGLFMMIAGLFLLKRDAISKLNFKKMMPLLLIFLFFIQGLYSIYVYQVLSGGIENDRSKMQLSLVENPYNPFNLLMTGRAESFVALIAIADKPIIGHGSWAPDPNGKYNYLLYALHDEKDKFRTKFKNTSNRFIPSHSVLFGAWMTAGIGGALGMGYILLLFWKRSLALLRTSSTIVAPFSPIILFYFLNGTWNFFFSPLGHIRQTIPLMVGFIIILYAIQNKIKLYE